MIGLLIYGSSKETKQRCESEEGLKKQVFHSQCTKNQDYEPVHQCMDAYVRQLEAIRDTVSNLDLKLPYTCCYYYEFKQVSQTVTNKVTATNNQLARN